MTQKMPFEALSVETLAVRLGANEALCSLIGRDTRSWKVREVGDGNLNLVFIVEGAKGAAVVKQALPYVRLVGDSWPLPLKRSFFEYHALTRQEARCPGSVPEIFHFDEGQALIVMEYLVAAHHPAPRADRQAGSCRISPTTSACSWPAPCFAAPTLPGDAKRAQGGSGAVRRQCRALRHHREPGLLATPISTPS